MTFLINPFGFGAAEKTETDFNAHIATLPSNGAKTWSANSTLSAGNFTTTTATNGGGMYDTVWNSTIDLSASACRIIQHALPVGLAWLNLGLGQVIYYRLESGAPKVVFDAVSRNGFTSSAYDDGKAYPTVRCTFYIRWDRVLNKAFWGNPSIGAAETEYTW